MTKSRRCQVTHAAPLHALRRIHEAFPAAAATPDARTGALPLHLAVGSGLPVTHDPCLCLLCRGFQQGFE